MLASVALLSFAIPSIASNYIVADVYENQDSCIASGSIQASAITQVGVCGTMPAGLPPPLNTVKSFMISSCANGDDFVSVTVDAYTGDSCTGKAIPYTFDDDIPSGCYYQAKVSCQADPVALAQKWPNTGVFLQDASCTNPVGIVAVLPGCSATDNGAYGSYSLNTQCSEDASSMHVTAYNDTLTCSGGVIDKETDIPTNTCTKFVEVPIPTAVSDVHLPRNLTLGDVLVSGYYKASCTGGY